MTCTTLDVPLGPPMVLHRAAPFPIVGMRFRSSSRVVYDTSAVRLRIGLPAETALVDVALTEDATDADDPSWYVTLTAEQLDIDLPARAEYVFVDADGLPMLYGSAPMVDHPRAV